MEGRMNKFEYEFIETGGIWEFHSFCDIII